MANRSGLRLGGATRSAAFFFLLRGTVALTLGRLFSVPNGTLVVGEGEHEFHIIACCLPAVGFAFAVPGSGYYNNQVGT